MGSLSRSAVIKAIQDEMPYLQDHFGVEQVALFGSFARGAASKNSDIDLVVSLSRPLGFAFIELANYLEEKLGRKVDIITSTTLEMGICDPRRAHIAKDIQELSLMSKGRRDRDFLLDIDDAIKRILEYTSGMTLDEYMRDYKTQDAVVRNLEVLGEATKNLSDGLQRLHPDIPWRDMAGTRDRLTHHYFGVNQEIVWQIIEHDLPGLLEQINQAMDELENGGS